MRKDQERTRKMQSFSTTTSRDGLASYAPLWCKSHFSFLEGASSPQEFIGTAKDLGLPAMALTDRDGMYGAVRAYAASRESGQKLILGTEASLEDRSSILLLAQDREGYANICGLLTRGLMRNPKGESRVNLEEVCESPEGVLVIWTDSGHDLSRQEESLHPLREAFGNLYLAVSRHQRVDDREKETRTRELSSKLGIPMVAANEVLYHHPERRKTQDVLTCIRHGVSLDAAGTLLRENGTHYLMAPQMMLKLFRDSPELLRASLEIAERCQFSMEEVRYRYPQERVPLGYTTDSWLGKLTLDGAGWRYHGNIPPQVVAQLEKELAIISQLEYAGYFLTMYEIVQYCRKKGILCQGRGSAANSAVCFCLGITAIDPVRMDLLFERFLSLERAEPPDIDLDIEHQRREEVIQHMYERYGRDRAAMVANLVRYRPRSAIRDVGKAFGFSEITLDRVAKQAPHWTREGVDKVIRNELDSSHPRVKNFMSQVEEILGFPRHLSIHPGGFLLGSESITRIVPTENATMPGRSVIQWDKEDIETLGLFKVDLLGLGSLTHLGKTFRLIATQHGRRLSIATIPPDDDATYRMLHRGDTVGVFQLESRAQMAMLPRIKPQNYYDIVIEIALIRPGPITGDMVHPYLRRRAGIEQVEYPHPSLEPVLKKTLGIPLFQEQVMKLATIAADYTPGEADQLRRDMAAWKHSGRIERHQEKLISRMMAKGIPREFAHRVFAQIRGFGEYGFPESHSASFAIIAYASAYLRAHYPAEFCCGLLNSLPMGFYSASSLVEDAKRHGVRFLPPDVLKSSWDCILEPLPRGNKSAIRLGSRFLRGLSKRDWEKVEEARSKGRLRTLQDFRTLSLPKNAAEILAESGALECFGFKRRSALWAVLDPVEPVKTETELLPYQEGRARFLRLRHEEEILWDYESSSLSSLGHLLESMRSELRASGLPSAAQVNLLPDKSMVRYAGSVICRQMPSNAGGVLFMTMEDETGFVNLVVWKKVYEEYQKIVLTHWFLGVTGRMQVDDGVVHLIPDAFWIPKLREPLHTRPESRDFH